MNVRKLTKYTARAYISPGVVSPPNFTLDRLKTSKNPKHPYAGIALAMPTSTTSTFWFDQPARRWIAGHASEPAMPAAGVSAPMTMSDDAGMCRLVFAKSSAVDVIVVNPSESRNHAPR